MRRILLACALLASILSSCSFGGLGAPPRGLDQPYRAEAPQKRGGTVLFSDWEFPDSFNVLAATAETDLRVGGLVFSPLWGLDSTLRPHPDLVREVPTVENGDVRIGADRRSMTVDVKLVSGLRWSDGQPLNADDVIFTWQAICDPATQAAVTSGFDHIQSMQKKSDTEVIWNFGPTPANAPTGRRSASPKPHCGNAAPIANGVYAPYLQLGPVMWIMPRHRLEKINHADWLSDPFFGKPDVTSGPFSISEIVTGDRITLTANARYADGRSRPNAYTDSASSIHFGHAPYLDRLVYKVYGDKNAMIAGLKAAETDIGFHLNPSDLGKLQGLNTSSAVTVGSLQDEFLNPNHSVNTATNKRPPWVTASGDDRPVLDALDRALDRQQLVGRVMNGLARVSRGLYPSALREFSDSSLASPSPDPGAANQILDADGWVRGSDGVRVKNGVRLAFNLAAVCSNPERQKELDFLKQSWSQLGASVKTDCAKRALFFASFSDKGVNAIGAFDMTLYSNPWQADPAAWAALGQSSDIPGAASPLGLNWNRCRDSELDRDFAAGESSLPKADRRRAYLAAQREWLAYHCTIPLFEWPQIVQVSNKVHNFAPNPSISMDVWNAADWWVQT